MNGTRKRGNDTQDSSWRMQCSLVYWSGYEVDGMRHIDMGNAYLRRLEREKDIERIRRLKKDFHGRVYDTECQGGPTCWDKTYITTCRPSMESLRACRELTVFYNSAMGDRDAQLLEEAGKALGYPQEHIEQDKNIITLLKDFKSNGDVEVWIKYLSACLASNRIEITEAEYEVVEGAGTGSWTRDMFDRFIEGPMYSVFTKPDKIRRRWTRKELKEIYNTHSDPFVRVSVAQKLGYGKIRIWFHEMVR